MTVTIAGVTPSAYNGTYTIDAILSTTQFTYTYAGGAGASSVHGTSTQAWADGDTLVINNGATVTVNTNQTKGWGLITINNGKLLISNSSTSTPITFLMRQTRAVSNAISDRTITLTNGLATAEAVGNWIEIGTGSGAGGQTMTLPYSDYTACVWVETGSGTGVYEKWVNITQTPFQRRLGDFEGIEAADRGDFGKCFTQAVTATTSYTQAQSYRQMFGTTITFGDGTLGALIPTGAKVRVPNIVISDSSMTVWSPGTLTGTCFQDSTLTRNARFSMSGGGKIDFSVVNFSLSYIDASQAARVRMTSCCCAIAPQFQEIYDCIVEDLGIGPSFTYMYPFPQSETAFTAQSVTSVTTTATVTFGQTHGFTTGMFVTIAGATPSAYNGTYAITGTTATTFTYTFAGGTSPATGTITVTIARRVSSATMVAATGTVTVTTDADHGVAVGSLVAISGATPTNYNGVWEVLTVPSSTQFTYQIYDTTTGTAATGTITFSPFQWTSLDYFIASNRRTWTQLTNSTFNKLTVACRHLIAPGGSNATDTAIIQFGFSSGMALTNSQLCMLIRHHPREYGIIFDSVSGATVSGVKFLGCGCRFTNSSNNAISDLTFTPHFGRYQNFSSHAIATACGLSHDPATDAPFVANTRYFVKILSKRSVHRLGYGSLGDGYITGRTYTVTPYVGPDEAHPAWFGATPTNNAVVLRWPRQEPAPTSGTRYEIYRSTTDGVLGSVVSTISTLQGTAVTSTEIFMELYNDTTAVNGTTYYYTLRKYNSAGVYTDSAQIAATPTANVSVTNLLQQSNDVTVSPWTRAGGASGASAAADRGITWQVWNSGNNGASSSIVTYGTDGTVSQTVTVSASTTYTFSVFLRIEAALRDKPSKTIRLTCFDNAGSPVTVNNDVEVTGDFKRYSVTITTGVGATQLTVRIGGNNTLNRFVRQLFIAEAQLNTGSSALAIVPTTGASATSNEADLDVGTATGATSGTGGIVAQTLDIASARVRLGTTPSNAGNCRFEEIHVGTTEGFTPSKATLVAWNWFGSQVSPDSSYYMLRMDTGSSNNTVSSINMPYGGPSSGVFLTQSNGNRLIGWSLNARGATGLRFEVGTASTSNNTLLADWDADYYETRPRKGNVSIFWFVTANNSRGFVLQNLRSNTLTTWGSSTTWLGAVKKGVATGKLYTSGDANTVMSDRGGNEARTFGVDQNYTTVYDTIFYELYDSATTGKLSLLCNGSTATIPPYTILSGAPTFQNDGTLLFGTAGDSIEWEWPHVIKGVSGFRTVDTKLTTGVSCYLGMAPVNGPLGDVTSDDAIKRLGCIKIEYSIDTGSGYGSLKRLTNANLTAESVSASAGFRIKIRMTAMRTIPFAGQSTAFVQGEAINGQTSGATAVVDEIVDNGTTGHLWVSSVTGTWGAAENIRSGVTVRAATLASPNQILPIQNQTVNNTRVAGLHIFTNVDQSVEYAVDTVTVKVTAKDASTLSGLSSARVLLYAAAGGPLPASASVTITRSGSTATVTHAAHGLSSGAKVIIAGANQGEYNGLFVITVLTSSTYTYTVSGSPVTPATGTITSTAVILDGTTDGSGVLQDTAFVYSTDQPVVGRVRRGTVAPYYKTAAISGTITSAGLDTTAFLVAD